MKRILLTGASGFIGSRLLGHLRAAGFEPIAAGRQPVGEHGIRSIVLSQLTADNLAVALAGESVDAIIHLAAAGVHPADRNQRQLLEINAHLPADLVHLAPRLGTSVLIMAGSNSEYASTNRNTLDEQAPLETLKLYGATKAAGGILAVSAGYALDIAVANLRLFNIFGPGEAPHRLLPSLIRKLHMDQNVDLSEGSQIRDFLHVDDACAAIMAALRGAAGQTLPTGHYNVCSGIGHSVRDFALTTAGALGADTSLLRFGALPMRSDEVARVVGDPTLFERLTHWRPALSFRQAVEQATAEMSHSMQHVSNQMPSSP